jgi:ankyrin repeat protein
VERRLVRAAHEGNLNEIRAALEEGANADGSVYSFYYPPLYTAAEAGQTNAVRLLLDNGAKVNQGDFINGTPLIVAAGNGYADVVQILLERGGDVCYRADGGTAEEFAQKRGHSQIVELLKAAKHEPCG